MSMLTLYLQWSLWELGLATGSMLGFYCLYKVASIIHTELTSPLCDLPGPPSKSLVYGNFKELFGGVRLHS